jgi:hypothetical protein
MVRVRAVRPLEGYDVEVTFTNGVVRRIDLSPYLSGPVFEPLRRDPEAFRAVFVEPVGKTLAWPNGADIDPDVLYLGLHPAN